jgi:hypothetical protein
MQQPGCAGFARMEIVAVGAGVNMIPNDSICATAEICLVYLLN